MEDKHISKHDIKRNEKRNLLSSFFISLLIGLAFQNMVIIAQDSINNEGVRLNNLILSSIFFLTGLRFFIGNLLHLLSDSFSKLRGGVWLYDLTIIVFQSTIIAFLAGVSTVEKSLNSTVDFFNLLIVLYLLDIVWIISQWFLGIFLISWRRVFIPWVWAVLNTILLALIFIIRFITADYYSKNGLILLLIVNLIAFIVDVVFVDYYDVL